MAFARPWRAAWPAGSCRGTDRPTAAVAVAVARRAARGAWWSGGLVSLAACLFVAGAAGAVEIGHCGIGRVDLVASSATTGDLRLACEAIDNGVEFLRSRGVIVEFPVHVRVVDELSSLHGVASLGQYDPERLEIRVLSLARFLAACAHDPPFQCSMTADVYRSFIVHEVVHAVTDRALAGRALRRLDLEYLAYVAQLASLPDDVREQLIAASGTQGFERPEEINAFIYFADPNRFGLMSYLHYRRPENGDAYLRKILGQR